MKGISEKPMANIILNGERLSAFLLRLKMRQGHLLSPHLINSLQGAIGNAIRKYKEI